MKKCGIYSIRNVTNGKIYIGSSNHIYKRWWSHKDKLNKNLHPNPHLQTSWNKYGQDFFEFTIVEECQEAMLVLHEDSWINYYNSRDTLKGYNLFSADRHICSSETRKRIGDGNRGKKVSDEAKISLSSISKKRSEETKQKIRAARLGKHISEETKQKMREKHIGKVMSQEAISKNSQSKKGSNNPMSK